MTAASLLCVAFASAAPPPAQPPQFLRDVAPILDRKGCSTAGCHGKFGGRGGFALSLLTLSPQDDYEPIVRDARGRRINRIEPDKSLLLVKATGGLNHGGGARFTPTSPEYRTLRAWIAAGAPYSPEKDARLVSLTVTPAQATLGKVGATLPLRVMAGFSDGARQDVTGEASYEAADSAIATVGERGLVIGRRWGGTAVIVRYLGAVRATFLTLPRADPTPFPALEPANIVDQLVFANLKRLNVHPSRRTTDLEFLRRLSLDVRGRLPEPAELAAFVADRAPDKRGRVIDAYLASPEFVDLRALRLGDLLRIHPRNLGGGVGERSAALFEEWVHDAVAANVPYDQFVRQIILARGSALRSGPTNFFRIDRAPEDRMETVAQAFLGQRMACARCHKHPFDRWTTDDYWNFAAFLGKIGLRGGEVEGEEVVYDEPGGRVINRSVTGRNRGREAQATLLGQGAPVRPPLARVGGKTPDSLAAFADWCVAADNPFFARATVNRLWSHYLGRGIVHPVDDMRATTPPSVPGLLEALARELTEHNFDLKHVIRLILNSKTYQTASDPNPTNLLDDRFFAHFYPRPMPGPVLLDAVNQATGTTERFGDFPPATHAAQLTLPVDSYFMDTFGRSHREFLADLEPKLEPTLVQILHILNGPYVNDKLRAPGGTVARLLEDKNLDDAGLIDALYRRTFCRPPTEKEKEAALRFLKGARRDEAAQDLLWALISAREFYFVS